MEEKLKNEILNKLHYDTLKYSEDSEKIETSYTVIKIGFLGQVFDKFLEDNFDLFLKYIVERKRNTYKNKFDK